MTIYVGNLSYDVTERDLKRSFGKYGEIVSATVVTDKSTQKSQGFGYVEMSDRARSSDALRELNDREFMGRKLMLKEIPTRGIYAP